MLLSLILLFLSKLPTAVASDKAPQVQECVVPAGRWPSGDGKECAGPRPSSVYVIGDIHGDAICAMSWINRMGLIANLLLPPNDRGRLGSSSSSVARPLYKRLNGPGKWRWTNANMTLVFMGDYVDKGLTARQTVEFVRDLTITFPNGVATILGNHELHHKPSYGNSNKFGDQMT